MDDQLPCLGFEFHQMLGARLHTYHLEGIVERLPSQDSTAQPYTDTLAYPFASQNGYRTADQKSDEQFHLVASYRH